MCGRGGMHGRGGKFGGWGGHAWQGACMAGETATAADGTHPTGIHSCIWLFFPENCMKIKQIGGVQNCTM